MSRKLPQVARRTLGDIERAAEEPADLSRPDPTGTAGERPPESGHDMRLTRAYALVDRYMAWSAIGGAVPLPLIEVASVLVLQVRMVRQLAELYERPFSGEAVRSTLLAAASGVLTTGGGSLAGFLLARAMPWAALVNMWVSSSLALASTLAIGRAYILHFESGGTALDLEPATLADHYRQALAERSAS